MNSTKRLLATAVAAALTAPMSAYATNGMNLSGYGPIASGMGGASMAYDNGSAAVMNNPATIGLMDDGNRFDVAIGFLGPNVSVEDTGSDAKWDSTADAFYMPAVGWVKKDGKMAYGVGVFAQGGMGTEFDDQGGMYGASPGGAMSAPEMGNNISYLDSMVDPSCVSGPCDHISIDEAFGGTTTLTDYANQSAATAVTLREYSEVSVGRLVAPFVYSVDSKLNVGGSLDLVWAGMDLQMAMPGSMMTDMMMGSQASGTVTGGLVNAMGQMFFDPAAPGTFDSTSPTAQQDFGAAASLTGLNYGYFDFANDNDYTGEASGMGFAAKLGFTYKLNSKLTFGGTYHSKTAMSDLEASGAKVNMSALVSAIDTSTGNLVTSPTDIVMSGTIKVKDFQWPQTIALGMSYQASDKLMFAADLKHIGWSDVMKDFTMEFTADTITMGGQDVTAMMDAAGGTDMTATMYQDWDDQTVIALGGAYQLNNATTLRAGANYADNPIPWTTLHYLFPAITQTHVTLGVGHDINNVSSVDFSVIVVPETERWMNGGANVAMDQTNWQFMYSHRF